MSRRRNAELLDVYHRLHSGLADMVNGERLTEADIPDDFQWLQVMLDKLGRLNPPTPIENLCLSCGSSDANTGLCGECQDNHCRKCGGDNTDGSGYDGLCGNCADVGEGEEA